MKRLLVVLDSSLDSTFAMDQALEMAKSLADAEIVLLYAEAPRANWQEGRRPKVGTGPAFILKRNESRAHLLGVSCRSRHERGEIAEVVARVAREEGCDLIITTEKGMGPLARAVMMMTGLCAPTPLKQLIEIAPVPVTVVSPQRPPDLHEGSGRPSA